jgi:hypothetical protein
MTYVCVYSFNSKTMRMKRCISGFMLLLGMSWIGLNELSAQNDFKIGMMMFNLSTDKNVSVIPSPYFTTATNTSTGTPTSQLNVLAEDGFNIAFNYGNPGNWVSASELTNYLNLVKGNAMQTMLAGKDYFKMTPPAGYPYKVTMSNGSGGYFTTYLPFAGAITGSDVFKKSNDCWTDIQNFFPLYVGTPGNPAPFQNTVWGSEITEEACYWHARTYDVGNCDPWQDVVNDANVLRVEVPPSNVSDALDYYNANSPNTKKVLMEAKHWGSIQEATNDDQGVYSIRDYVHLLPKHPNQVFFEGSYSTPRPSSWYQNAYTNIWSSSLKTSDYQHYLGFLESFNYVKAYTNNIQKVISTDFSNSGGDFYSSDPIHNQNGNWLWFQAYSSIIHGAKGIWFWGLGNAYPDAEVANKNNLDNANDQTRFQRSKFPSPYNDYIAKLTRELRYLANTGFLSTDESTVLYSKTDGTNGVKNLVTYDDAWENMVVNSSLSWSNNWAAGYKPTCSGCDQHTNLNSDPNYNLRYTIRTNGTDVIVIVSNPLQFPVKGMFDFSCMTNVPAIANSNSVDFLFNQQVNTQLYASAANLLISGYKQNRNSGIDLVNNTISPAATCNQAMVGANNKKLTLYMGPLDVVVFKFHQSPPPPPVANSGWNPIWMNNGNNMLGKPGVGWAMSADDQVVAGDFLGTGHEELLCVSNNSRWAALLEYSNNNWNAIWNNSGNGWVGGWNIGAQESYYPGRFDGTNARGVCFIQRSDVNSWAMIQKYDPVAKAWNVTWNNGGNGTLGSWTLAATADDKFMVGDFNKDGSDEILSIQSITGVAKAMMQHIASGNTWTRLWINGVNGGGIYTAGSAGWGIGTNDTFIAGDFDGDGYVNDLMCIERDGKFLNTELTYVAASNTWKQNWVSTGNINPLWGPPSLTDQILCGNLDYSAPDELMFIQRNPGWGWSSYGGFSATNPYALSLSWSNWGNGLINNWNLAATGTLGFSPDPDTRYLLVRAANNLPKYLLALRYGQCTQWGQAGMYGAAVVAPPWVSRLAETQTPDAASSLVIYPNPNTGTFTLAFGSDEERSIRIANPLGQVIYQARVSGIDHQVDLSGYPTGMYFVTVTGIGHTETQKVLVK